MIRVAAILLLVLLTTSCVGTPAEDATGKDVYIQICSSCHAVDLSGGIGLPIGPDSNAATQSDEFLRMTIENGRGSMPSFRLTLSDGQIDRLIDYLRIEQGK